MGPWVDFRHADGRMESLAEGEWIGRSWRAALRLDDPRISEAHALLSLRGSDLVLLALRGPLVVDGRRTDRVVLRPGLQVLLAPDVALTVDTIVLPETGFALEGPGLPSTFLAGSAGLALPPRLVHPTHRDARAWLWATDDGWRFRDDSGTRPVPADGHFELDGVPLRLVSRPLRGRAPTVSGPGGDPTRIVLRYDSVHLFRGERPAVVLSGRQARLVSELASFAAPVDWPMIARAVWPDDVDRQRLRKRLDGTLSRLRRVLREGGQRADLVRPLGTGQFELLLYPDDVVVDEQ